MDDKLYSQIRDAIRDRSQWEGRMSDFYKIRFSGIRRSRKPYPGAPDVHYPLIDSDIEKLKPFYVQQLYADSVIATFVCEDYGIDRGQVSALERWFDYQLKQRSTIEDAIIKGVDYMLTYGFCPVKVYWDAKGKRLAYSPIDPMYTIVPQWTEDDQPDFLVHVMRMSKAQYRLNDKFNQDPAFLTRIAGTGYSSTLDVAGQREQDKAEREGLTYSRDKDQVVIWEVYYKQDGKIVVETVSPSLQPNDTPVREPFGLPYPHGEMPFVVLRYDSGQSGWYSSRGIPEIIGEHEMSLNKMWNSKLQFLDFFGHPVYQNNNLSPVNTANFQAAPGRILPPGVTPIVPESAPIDFQQEMQFIRALAEDRIAIPDLGAGEHLTGKTKGQDTATKTNAIMALSNQSNDLRSRMFRSQLAHIYNQSWEILSEFAADQINYVFDKEAQTLDAELLQHKYSIKPSGSADSWNKQARQNYAMAMYAQFSQNPYIRLGEFTKWVFEQNDPRLIERLVQDPQEQQGDQQEQQAQEIGLMMIGFPPKVKPTDDDAVHVQTMLHYGEAQAAKGQTVPPDMAQQLFAHAQGHLAQMKQKKNPQFGQMSKAVAQAQKMYMMSMPQQPQMPAGGGMPQGQPQGQPNEQDKPSATANALANLMKSGAQVSVADVNAALLKMGLPPLASSVAPTSQHLNTAQAIAGPVQKPQQPPKQPQGQ